LFVPEGAARDADKQPTSELFGFLEMPFKVVQMNRGNNANAGIPTHTIELHKHGVGFCQLLDVWVEWQL